MGVIVLFIRSYAYSRSFVFGAMNIYNITRSHVQNPDRCFFIRSVEQKKGFGVVCRPMKNPVGRQCVNW